MTEATRISDLVPAVNTWLPWTIDIDPYMTAIANTNWNAITVHAAASSIYNGAKESSGAQNDAISWDIVVPAGTWTFELMHVQATNRGIYTVSFVVGTSTDWGTIDGYKSSTTYNVRSSIAGVNVTTTSKGRLTLAMKTQNASSSAYYGSIQHMQLRRTA